MAEVPRSWHAVDVTAPPTAAEAIESAFNVLDSLGTEIDSLRKRPGEPLTVTGFFEATPDRDDVRTAVEESLAIFGVQAEGTIDISYRTVGERDWLAEWKKHWVPQDSGRFTVAPPWYDVPKSDQLIISIDPNMAFGTGTHETTKLCLNAISEFYSPEKTFLDVGTGTGILAIAAAKMGGRSILACDVDRDSVTIARGNANTNGVKAHMEFFEGSITRETQVHDVVCANLTLDVIQPLLPLLFEKTGEVIILSGILAEQEETALREVRKFVGDLRVDRDGEWIAIIAWRDPPPSE
jgi:ribosomal protein L11 methyltransferase